MCSCRNTERQPPTLLMSTLLCSMPQRRSPILSSICFKNAHTSCVDSETLLANLGARSRSGKWLILAAKNAPRKGRRTPHGTFFHPPTLSLLVWIAFYALDGIAITESFPFLSLPQEENRGGGVIARCSPRGEDRAPLKGILVVSVFPLFA